MTKLTRRDFLKVVEKVLAATGLAAVLGPVIAYFYPPNLEEPLPRRSSSLRKTSSLLGKAKQSLLGAIPPW